VSLRIGIVAAEPSGDLLGAGLMQAIRTRRPDVCFEGIGGEGMTDAGLDSWVAMEKLSVMGLVEVLKHLPELMGIRRDLIRRWRESPPDLFIGVDAPDFNLHLETRLRESGIPTVHYVCPTVWAWRPKRVLGVRRAVDLLLSIFPFEEAFLREHDVPVRYVGHPLAHALPLDPDRATARQELGLAEDRPVLAILPGSRGSEIGTLAEPFLKTAACCAAELPGLQLVVPLVNDKTRQAFDEIHRKVAPELDITVVQGKARTAMAAADVVLTASGTATFECLLSKRPMVVGYKVHWLTYVIACLFKLIKVDHIAMANIIAGERLAPEFVQKACEPEQLTPAVLDFFRRPDKVAAVQARYREIHQSMDHDTNGEAAEAVLALLQGHADD